MTTAPPPVLHAPTVTPLPTVDELASYLSITAASRPPDVDAALTGVLVDTVDYQLGRCSYDRMIAAGADPPTTVPANVSRAILMDAARLYRRANSVNGYDGYDDLGTVPVRGNDPEIERMIDPYRAWCWA
jgi:hypothetical protein